MFPVKIMNINQRYQRFMRFQLKNKKLSMAAVFFNLWLSLFTSPPAACVSRWPIWSCWGPDTWGLGNSYHLLLGLVSLVIVAQDGHLARWGEARVQLFCWTWLQAAPAFPAKSTSLSSLLFASTSLAASAQPQQGPLALLSPPQLPVQSSPLSDGQSSNLTDSRSRRRRKTWRSEPRTLSISADCSSFSSGVVMAGMLEVPVTENGRGLRLLAVYKSCVQDKTRVGEKKWSSKMQRIGFLVCLRIFSFIISVISELSH